MNTNASFVSGSSIFSSDLAWIEKLKRHQVPVRRTLGQIMSAIGNKAIYQVTVLDVDECGDHYTPLKPGVFSDCILCDCIDLFRIKILGNNSYLCDEYVDDIKSLMLVHLKDENGCGYYEIYMLDYCHMYSKYELIIEK